MFGAPQGRQAGRIEAAPDPDHGQRQQQLRKREPQGRVHGVYRSGQGQAEHVAHGDDKQGQGEAKSRNELQALRLEL
jgi:hypothetical protein